VARFLSKNRNFSILDSIRSLLCTCIIYKLTQATIPFLQFPDPRTQFRLGSYTNVQNRILLESHPRMFICSIHFAGSKHWSNNQSNFSAEKPRCSMLLPNGSNGVRL
jgi:hypothetical protein